MQHALLKDLGRTNNELDKLLSKCCSLSDFAMLSEHVTSEQFSKLVDIRNYVLESKTQIEHAVRCANELIEMMQQD